MSISRILKAAVSAIAFTIINFLAPYSYADNIPDSDTRNLIAGFGTAAISKNLMNTAPVKNEVTMAIDPAQAAAFNPANSPLIGQLTRDLLMKIAKLGKDKNNDALSLAWTPDAKMDPDLAKDPLKAIDANALLGPVIYSDAEKTQAKYVIDAFSSSLLPLDTVNFAQLVSGLSGDKNANLIAKLHEKRTQSYLATLRVYLAGQAAVANNLYQLYVERQAIDPAKVSADPALKAAAQVLGSLSPLKLESFMATRRILDKNWNAGLLTENPATLEREKVLLAAETLAEAFQTRMTLERLQLTMSLLLLTLNQQARVQLQNQAQSLSNPSASQLTG